MTRPALRSKQVRAAKAVGGGLTYAEAGALVGRSRRTVTRWLQEPELRLIAEREGGAFAGEVAPVETLRAALQATKASGQPDWATRLSAARALAALPAEEGKPESADQQSTPSIVVYDLPPGANPVLHRPASGAEATPGAAAKELSEQVAITHHEFLYKSPDGESELIGAVSPAESFGEGIRRFLPHVAYDPETAKRWRAELAAGRLPTDQENAS